MSIPSNVVMPSVFPIRCRAVADQLLPLPEDWERGIAIVAHPDDLEYGAASAIARWTGQGKEIVYVLASAGEAGIDGMLPSQCARVRMEEERRGAARVGVDVVEFLDHRDGVIEYGTELRRDLARAIRRHRPDVVITSNFHLTWGGPGLNMADHRNVGLAAMDAARDAGNRWVFPELLDEGLEPWNGARRIFVNASPAATHAVDVTDTLERGVASLREHRVYLEGLGDGIMTDPEAFLRGAAESTAARFGGRPAVSFELFEW
jgi:LmbE family N-acetylglucosaminyl deacetylase